MSTYLYNWDTWDVSSFDYDVTLEIPGRGVAAADEYFEADWIRWRIPEADLPLSFLAGTISAKVSFVPLEKALTGWTGSYTTLYSPSLCFSINTSLTYFMIFNSFHFGYRLRDSKWIYKCISISKESIGCTYTLC